MASGHVTRTKGRTHGCTDQLAGVKKVLANSEPSTHGTFLPWQPRQTMSGFRGGDLNRSTQHLLILLDKEVADGDVTDIVHGEAEG